MLATGKVSIQHTNLFFPISIAIKARYWNVFVYKLNLNFISLLTADFVVCGEAAGGQHCRHSMQKNEIIQSKQFNFHPFFLVCFAFTLEIKLYSNRTFISFSPWKMYAKYSLYYKIIEISWDKGICCAELVILYIVCFAVRSGYTWRGMRDCEYETRA